MKRLSIIAAAFLLFTTAVNAYNPPANGESIYEISSARMLSTASSITGGAIFNGNVSASTVNPALPFDEQRVSLNAGFTMLFSTNPANSKSVGTAMQIGALIPTKWTVFSLYMNGTFVPFEEMNFNDSVNFKFGVSKQITEKISLGLGLNTGFLWGAGKDWSLSGNIGLLCTQGDLGFIKDFRYGLTVTNLGKNYGKTTATGMNPMNAVSEYPTICTVKAGVAGLFVQTSAVSLGFSLDVGTPLFQDFMIDAGLECSIKDIVFISVAERFKLMEYANGYNDFIPAIGIGVKFNFGFKGNDMMNKNGWSESEISTTAAYKQMFNSVNAISTEMDLKLGMEDNTPPVITLWFGDEGDD